MIDNLKKHFLAFMQWLAKSMEEEAGITSLLRIVVFFIVTICIAVPTGVWAVLSLHDRKILEIPGSVTGFFLPAVTAALAAKVSQRFGENQSNPPPNPPN